MLKASFEAYDALGNLLPKQEYEIVSSFPTGEYAIGIWVKNNNPNIQEDIISLYLTQEQLDQAVDYEYY